MKRRSVIKGLAAGTALTLGGGLVYISRPADHPELALDRALDRLHGLRADAIETDSAWDVARTFNHLAQSIEFSMTGYPELKSGLFRHTVGRVAYNVFQTRGEMSHNRAEVIPGEVIETSDPETARQRLITSLMAFQAFDADLRPHFAYGSLPKDAYAKAHVMHINDHLAEFRVI
ncbi:DUF1569 domain-containing protein [Roseovarius sp. 2305UL8-3]|uniref:DUF1569 domain-containing protein n=1 Tax=Roseovarius conchicola TaxID=3121636 RepID=UPI003528E6E3